MIEVVVTTGAIRHAKLQSTVTTNKPTSSFLQARCPSCCPTNSIKALKGNHLPNKCTGNRHLRTKHAHAYYLSLNSYAVTKANSTIGHIAP